MDTLIKDIRYAIRGFMRQPGFTAVVVITLALGIGVNTAIFSVTDKLLIRSLPVKNPDRLVLLNSVSVSPYFVSNAFSYPVFTDYRDQNEVFQVWSLSREPVWSYGQMARSNEFRLNMFPVTILMCWELRQRVAECFCRRKTRRRERSR